MELTTHLTIPAAAHYQARAVVLRHKQRPTLRQCSEPYLSMSGLPAPAASTTARSATTVLSAPTTRCPSTKRDQTPMPVKPALSSCIWQRPDSPRLRGSPRSGYLVRHQV